MNTVYTQLCKKLFVFWRINDAIFDSPLSDYNALYTIGCCLKNMRRKYRPMTWRGFSDNKLQAKCFLFWLKKYLSTGKFFLLFRQLSKQHCRSPNYLRMTLCVSVGNCKREMFSFLITKITCRNSIVDFQIIYECLFVFLSEIVNALFTLS